VEFLTAGVVLGLSAGLSPGPLLALVLAQTLQFGAREGIKVALAPLVTDGPIILLSVYVVGRLAVVPGALAAISLCGGVFVLSLAYQNLRATSLVLTAQRPGRGALVKGVLVNALSPHPYLFWLTVGAPTIAKAAAENQLLGVLFVGSFWGCLVGSKVCLATLVGRSRHQLSDRAYRTVMRVLGLVLVAFAGLLIYDGCKIIAGRGA
jgi:threonine/homoserine/homoserine lactone efflux protein